ncbi:MAG: RHS repeat protein [Planctomycetaceae bacterium]|nr:RHS repeat protein [Planctomycetaceae bacterium]
MRFSGRLGLGGLVLVGAVALVVSLLARPFVPAAMAVDNDGDGLSLAFETAYGTSDAAADTDGDTWTDWYEIFVKGTDPSNADTDGDGIQDNVDPYDDGNDADGNTVATWTWAENLTSPAWTGTSAVDAMGFYPHSGEFQHSLELLRIDPGYGPSMNLTIYYRSGITYDGPVGNNWVWLPRLAEQPNGDVYLYVQGIRRTYEPDSQNPGRYFAPADAVNWNTLTKNLGNGTFTLANRGGGVWGFNSNGRFISDADLFGNTVTYTYTNGKVTSIADASGHTVTVAWYAGKNRVQSITDGDNRQVVFTYNHFGQLAKVRTPTAQGYPNGRTNQFVYSNGSQTGTLNDNMVRALDPKGQVWLRNEFDENDRTTKQYLGNDYFTFTYVPGTSTTQVVDREGNQRDWYVPSNVPGWLKEYSNRDVRASDPSYWQTTFTHDGATLRTKVVYPRGNSVKTTYDSAGNATAVRKKADDTQQDNDTNDIVETSQYDANYNLMTSHTDAGGNTTSYTLESQGALTNKVVVTVTYPTVTYLEPDQSASESMTWNSHGQLVSQTDGEGKVRTNVYFSDEGEQGVKKGYLKKVVVDSGLGGLALTTEYDYKNWGTRTSETNPRGYATTYTVNNYDWVTAVTGPNPQNYEVAYTFDANGNVTQRDVENVDKDNSRDGSNPWFTTTYVYDILNNLTGKTEEIDSTHTRTWGYELTKNEKMKTLTKPEGNKVRYVYDERDLIYTQTRGYGTAVASSETSDYDGNRNLTSVTNGRSKTWVSSFDLFDRRTKETNPLGHYSERVYDKEGHVTELKRWEEAGQSDILLEHTKHYFDERGRLYRSERGLKGQSSWSWYATTLTLDKRGLVASSRDPRNKDSYFDYDGASRMTREEDALGNRIDSTYDAAGNVTLVEEYETTGYATAKTFVTECSYDPLNRRTEVRVVNESDANDKHITTNAYDSLGVMVEQVDPESNATTWTHDGLARVLARSIDLGSGIAAVTTQGYDRNDRVVSRKDDANNETTWEYNARDLKTAETYSDSGAMSFAYDLADNLTQWVDPNGTQVDLTYDDNNRNTARTVTRAAGVGGTTSESFSFDALDRQVEAKDDDVTVQFTWDSIGRKLTETSGPNPLSTYGKTTAYTYDAAGNTTRLDYPDGSFAVQSAFDDINRATLLEDGNGVDIAEVQYFGGKGRLKRLTFGNSTDAFHDYSGFRWLSDIDHKDSSSQLLAGYDVLRDKVSNPLYEEWSHDSGKGHNYWYDKAYRITKTLQGCADPSAEHASPGSQAYGSKVEYNWTDDGDRTSVVTTPYGQGGQTVNYTVDSMHHYTVVGGVNRSHDANGNLVDDGTNEYAYDFCNHLIQVTRKSDSVVLAEYEYDALGRRTKKCLPGGAEVRFYHDRLNEIEEFDQFGSLVRKFVFRPGQNSLAMMEAPDCADVDDDLNTVELVRLYYHMDGCGMIARVTGPNQTVVESYVTDPFGGATIRDKNGGLVSSSQIQNPYFAHCWRMDAETGYYHMFAHYGDRTIGLITDALYGPLASIAAGHQWAWTNYWYVDVFQYEYMEYLRQRIGNWVHIHQWMIWVWRRIFFCNGTGGEILRHSAVPDGYNHSYTRRSLGQFFLVLDGLDAEGEVSNIDVYRAVPHDYDWDEVVEERCTWIFDPDRKIPPFKDGTDFGSDLDFPLPIQTDLDLTGIRGGSWGSVLGLGASDSWLPGGGVGGAGGGDYGLGASGQSFGGSAGRH